MKCDKEKIFLKRYNLLIFHPISKRLAPLRGTDFSRFNEIFKKTRQKKLYLNFFSKVTRSENFVKNFFFEKSWKIHFLSYQKSEITVMLSNLCSMVFKEKNYKKIKLMTLFCCWRFLQKYIWNLSLTSKRQKEYFSEYGFLFWVQGLNMIS